MTWWKHIINTEQISKNSFQVYEEIDDIVKIVKSLEDFDLLIKRVSKTIKNEAKEQKMDFLACY